MSSLNCLNNNNQSLLTTHTPNKTPKLSGGTVMQTPTTGISTLPTTQNTTNTTTSTSTNTTITTINNTTTQHNQVTQLLFQLITHLVNSMQGGASQSDMTQINNLLGTLGTLTGGLTTSTTIKCPAPTCEAGPQGIQGEKGEKGDKGDQGLQGEKGEKGMQGDKGDQGLQGEKGMQGDKGDQGDQGIQGAKGEKGDKGDMGVTGNDGQSAYQLWLAQGNEGTKQQFLLSLMGENGADGKDGVDGQSAYQIWIGAGNQGTEQDFLNSITGEKGAAGADGQSAYQIWLGAGNTGTEQQFLMSLMGADGQDGADGMDGQSAYQIWLGQGNKGTEAEFLTLLQGAKGEQGAQGIKGEKGDIGDTGAKGEKGDTGAQGAQGEKGDTGATGQSAYQLWLANGNQGSEQQFLLSLVGQQGADGKDGVDGQSAYQIWIGAGNQGTEQDFLNSITGEKGAAGADGQSAYQIWLGAGNTGTEQQFLMSLMGADGQDGADGMDGQSAYQIWLGQGNKGTEAEFLTLLQGAKGEQGAQGIKGEKGDIGDTGAKGEKGDTGAQGAQGEKGDTGATGQSAYQLWLANGNQGSEQQFLLSLVGQQGADGKDGVDGQSAYQVWLGMGNNGSEADFLASLQGAQGAKGEKGDTGAQGMQGVQGEKGDKGDTGQGFFEWFSGSVGDHDQDGDIDKTDIQQWLMSDVPDATTKVAPEAEIKPILTDINDGSRTGQENTPLTLGAAAFNLPANVDGIEITQLPNDGKLEYRTAEGWKPASTGQEFSKAQLQNGDLRFIPDPDESGINGNPQGVGNGKSDYAHVKYAGVADGKPVTTETVLAIDIKPDPEPVKQIDAVENDGPKTTVETAMQGSGTGMEITPIGGLTSQYFSTNQPYNDEEHWSDVAKAYGAEIKEDDKGRYIHAAPMNPHFTRWVDVEASEQNPEGLRVKISPVALDTNGDGKISTTGASTAKIAGDHELGRTVNFDMNADGKTEAIEWLEGNGDSLLVDNTDGNAANDMNGSRLFGDEGGRYNNGYEKMALRDANGDGKLTGEELSGLELWFDNGDAKVDDGELRSLAEAGITELNVNMTERLNEFGETLMQSDANGGSILTEDVWFATKEEQ